MRLYGKQQLGRTTQRLEILDFWRYFQFVIHTGMKWNFIIVITAPWYWFNFVNYIPHVGLLL